MMLLQELKSKPTYLWTIALITALSMTNGAFANVIGSGTQNFSPSTGFHDFATVNSSDTLPAKNFHLGLFLNNASNTLPYGSEVDGDDQNSNQLTSMDLQIGYGITKRFHLAFSTPFVVAQQFDEDSETHSQFAKEGNTEFRIHAKYKLLGKESRSGLAFVFNAVMDRLSDNPHRGENVGMAYIPEIAGDIKVKNIVISGNLGYKIQDQGEEIEGSLFQPFGNKILYSTAVGVLVNKRKTKLFVELFGDRPVEDVENASDRDLSSLEALLGVKHLLNPTLAMNLGAGTEMQHGVSTPDLRVFAGVNWLIAPAAKKVQLAKKKKRKKRKKIRRRPKPAPMPVIDVEEETIAVMDLIPEETAPATGPATAEIPTRAPDEVIVLNNVNFVFDSDRELMRGDLVEIDKVARYVEGKHSQARIVIEGHTCHMGSHGYNNDLSFRRAKSIRAHLINNYGFSPEQVVAVGYGENHPTVSNSTERGRKLNRRVEFKIYEAQSLSAVGY